jgi:hypothetical protein
MCHARFVNHVLNRSTELDGLGLSLFPRAGDIGLMVAAHVRVPDGADSPTRVDQRFALGNRNMCQTLRGIEGSGITLVHARGGDDRRKRSGSVGTDNDSDTPRERRKGSSVRQLLCASIVAAAAAAALASPAAAPADPLAGARAVIGEARCSGDHECRTIAYGSRPCGGPAGFLAWSVRGTDRSALESALRSASGAGAPGDRFSTCELLADPGATCRKEPGAELGRCVLGPLRRGQPSLPTR